MAELNFQHLLYFWTVVRAGSLSAAARELMLSPATISLQLKSFEERHSVSLLEKRSRRLVPTAFGQEVFAYAEQIFGLGLELRAVLEGQGTPSRRRLRIGVSPALPKRLAWQVIELALVDQGHQVIIEEHDLERLAADLAVHQLDLALCDAPLSIDGVRLSNEVLADFELSIFGSESLCGRYARSFPESLQGAPFLLPGRGAACRPALLAALDTLNLEVQIVAEVTDSALLKIIAARGLGLFAAPTVLSRELSEHYELRCLGPLKGVHERLLLASAARYRQHSLAPANSEAARAVLAKRD